MGIAGSPRVSQGYGLAQRALSDLKMAIQMVLARAAPEGLNNAEIGRQLGIYQAHVGHEGHIPRTLLAIIEAEGVVEQHSERKRWRPSSTVVEDNEKMSSE